MSQCAQPSSSTPSWIVQGSDLQSEDVLLPRLWQSCIHQSFFLDIQSLGDKLYTNSLLYHCEFWDLLILMKQVCIQKLLRIKNQWPVKGKPIMSESPGSNPKQSNQVCANLWNTTQICGKRCCMWWRPYFSAAGKWRCFGMWWQFLWSVGARPLGWRTQLTQVEECEDTDGDEKESDWWITHLVEMNDVLHISLKCELIPPPWLSESAQQNDHVATHNGMSLFWSKNQAGVDV